MNINHTDMQQRAQRVLSSQISNGAGLYDRKRLLSRVLPLAAGSSSGDEPAATRQIVLHLARALRAERRRGRTGHWTYDLNKHIALAQV